MSLWAYALRTVAETKASAWVTTGSAADTLIEACVNQASEMVEKAWGRHLITRGDVTEYHPRLDAVAATGGILPTANSAPYGVVGPGGLCNSIGPELYLNEYPVISVTSVHEDVSRAYGAGALLTPDTDYLVSKPAGKLVRLSGGLPRGWLSSWRCVRVVYKGGFATTADLPPAVLRVFDELVGWMIRQRSAKETGLSITSDALGSRTFQGPAFITSAMQQALDEAGASAPNTVEIRTGERDA